MIRITNRLVVLALGLAILTAATAGTASAGDTLQLTSVLLKGQTPPSTVTCPQGTPANASCWSIHSTGVVRGLGNVIESGVLVVQNPDTACEKWQASPELSVAGKGTFQLSLQGPPCISNPSGSGESEVSLTFTVTGGTGLYAGASGSGTDITDDAGCACHNAGDTLNGTLTAPNTSFDLTPPVISVKAKKTVTAPKGATRVRVRYRASAQDAVDGPVPVKCTPRSGSFFRVGRRTRVTCTATDSSANTARKTFTITVKRG